MVQVITVPSPRPVLMACLAGTDRKGLGPTMDAPVFLAPQVRKETPVPLARTSWEESENPGSRVLMV